MGSPHMMKLLVLTSEPIEAKQLRAALPDDIDPAETEVALVAPALHDSPLKFWTADADEAIDRAKAVWHESVRSLRDQGVEAHGDTGESDPVQAIQDALQTFPAERILLFTHAGEGQHYREDVDLDEVRERFGLPVDRAAV